MKALGGTFSSLRNRNYRRYFTGHAVSASGEWMQRIGQAWLVLELTDSGTMLGVTAGLQHLPTLVMGPWGGLLADRLDKRRLLIVTQIVSGSLAVLLGALTATQAVEVWMVLGLAFALGTVKALDRPAKQSFVLEMVGPADIANAVTLNSVVFNAAKAVGPAIAGALIATVGLAASFYFNAASYFALLGALLLIDTDELRRSPVVQRGPGQLRAGLRYVRATPALAGPLALMAVSGLLAYEWAVILPLFAREAFGGDAQTFGSMYSAMGIGAVGGGLIVAGLLRPRLQSLLVAGLVFGALVVVTAFSPTLEFALLALVLLGAASLAFRATATSLLQLRADPEMRGRMMALLGVALGGTTPVGGPLVGWLAEMWGPRTTLAFAGLATGAATLGAYWYLKRERKPGDVEGNAA